MTSTTRKIIFTSPGIIMIAGSIALMSNAARKINVGRNSDISMTVRPLVVNVVALAAAPPGARASPVLTGWHEPIRRARQSTARGVYNFIITAIIPIM